MVNKQLINGLKYEKQTEDQLYDLSQWELVDIILAYREDLKAKEQECEAYKMEAEEGKEINAELKAENDELKKCYKNNSALLDFEETNTTKLVNKVMKLEKTLTEIKEIAEFYNNSNMDDICYSDGIYDILQKISKCEVK